MALTLEAAYAECARITAREAKNFSYGIRLLPPPKRNAMSALYAMARRIDDVADSDDATTTKLARLAVIDDQISVLVEGGLPDAGDAVLVGLHDAMSRFPIPIAALGEIVEGCRRDATGVEYATFADTEAYCRLVAGSVGRLSLGVFGTAANLGEASVLADDLGVALQLTNILRDIVEDREMGRTYLPADDIKRFGGTPGPLLVRHYVDVAEGFYARGLPLLPLLDRRSRACVAAMAGIYHRLLAAIRSDPAAVLHGRVSLSTRGKLWVAARSLAGRQP
jgi:15-cis-phytoene synthase